ncbi:unnamed protein product [Echinostoma caproni]|uniref:Aquaporin n=1 Tax=Echinostoma caproni TaxID=27848 RepID=A0A183ABH8_9TREM|nr:unnamed protein product [Echinostoma caproni]
MGSSLVQEYPAKPTMNKIPSCTLTHMAYLARLFVAELLGLGLILFVIVIYKPGDKLAAPVPCVVGAVFAWVVCVFGPISGAQVNPAVSLALILTRRLSVVHGIVCIVAQILGATCGVLLGRIAGPANVTNVPNVGMTIRNPDVSVPQAVGLEVFATMILVGIVLAVSDEFRGKPWTVGNLSVFPIMFGITLFMLASVVGPYTGGSMNPALSLGGALANLNFKEIWIYIISPLTGSIIVTLLYELLLSDGASLARLKAMVKEADFDRKKNYTIDGPMDEEDEM